MSCKGEQWNRHPLDIARLQLLRGRLVAAECKRSSSICVIIAFGVAMSLLVIVLGEIVSLFSCPLIVVVSEFIE